MQVPLNSIGNHSFSPLNVLSFALSLPILLTAGSANAQFMPESSGARSPQWFPGFEINGQEINEQAQTPAEEVWEIEEIPVPEPSQPEVETLPAPQREGTADPTNDSTSDARFICEMVNNQPTVMYYPPSQPSESYPWAVPGLMGGGWTPERRCGEIARRLESYRPDGLVELRTSVENGYNTICATTEDVPNCRIVLTVPQGENPVAVRDRIFQNLVVADSGNSTQGVYTFTNDESTGILRGLFGRPANRSNGINLKPFLDPIDGGSGSNLR
ncbi:MAG: COP23 domain-containing protein [Microcoleaceae cyanobacterium]